MAGRFPRTSQTSSLSLATLLTATRLTRRAASNFSELREAIASVIAIEKAHNVPALCVRLGLDDGEESEAMSSKARYASSRLAKLPADRRVPNRRSIRLLAEREVSLTLSASL
jgi:hypothetical protein